VIAALSFLLLLQLFENAVDFPVAGGRRWHQLHRNLVKQTLKSFTYSTKIVLRHLMENIA
jgi:hypothetical protein